MFRSIKPKSENKERLKRACSTAASALQATLRIAKAAAGDAAVPGLKAAIGGLLLAIDVMKKTSQNAEDVERLTMQIHNFNLVLEGSKNGGTLSQVAIDRIDRLFTTSNAASEQLQQIASRPAIMRSICSADDAQLISSHTQTITLLMQAFTAETTVAIESALDQHTARTEKRAIRTQEKVNHLHETATREFQKMNARLDTKDEHPPHAFFSPFNCKYRAGCLEGTRADILHQIFGWIGGIGDSQPQIGAVLDREPNTVSTDTCIFWINGSAGTGKSTIAYTVAEACNTFDILGASFFCSRDDADCSNPNMIFTSIAYQLGIFNPLFGAEVTRAMKSNPDIGYAIPPYQLQELIIKPLQLIRHSISPCVVVLDALDECKETGMISIILSSLSRHVDELFPLKFLVTSRPESHITTVFRSNELNPVTRRYVLHEVELGVVQNDIKHFLSTKITCTRELYQLGNEWPSIADIDALTQMSFGLFIFASTSVKFIEDENFCDPKHQLSRLVCNAPTAMEGSSPFYNLDQLYGQVLNHAFPNISSHLSDRLKTILGTIVLLRDPLSSVALERLLDLPSLSVGITLRRLHSVIMVPDDDTQVIRTLHPSFFDFITNPTRCLNPRYVVDPQTQHTLLAHACLAAMKELKRDICGIRNPSLLNSEVDDLQTRAMTCIRPELQYACRHWSWHLENATFSGDLASLVNEFCLDYLLYWLEVLSLIGDLRSGLLALDVAQKTISKADEGMTDAKDLLHDCERFTREFFWIINSCSLQIYHSALLFTPEETSIKKIYGRELDLPVKIYNGMDKSWNSCIRTIEGHSRGVYLVAFSPDGARIVSASGDNTVRLWDAVSGAHLNTLEGHSNWVECVEFSPDGTRIVSASGDHTLRLWDAATGAHLKTLEGHSDCVQSAAFSPDSTRVVSGSYDNTVRVWDAVNGAPLNTLEGHSNWVECVAFSPDGTRIISSSGDTVRLWDAVNGAHLNTLERHPDWVECATFSPDGTRIVSASGDTIWLWDAFSGERLSTLEGHSMGVYSVTFSPDGTLIVSGSADHTVRLWDATSGTHLKTFEGHSNCVPSVTFSPDGTRIMSGSFDNTIRLWDAINGARLNTFREHFLGAESVRFSPDGTRIVSGLVDGTIQLWDVVSGTRLNTLESHSDYVEPVVFSADGTRIVSVSDYGTFRLWDAASGSDLNTLEYPTLGSSSPDTTPIMSGSGDNTVRLWDAVRGAYLNTIDKPSNWVLSVAFSLDGTRIVSGSVDGAIRLWNPVDSAHLNTLRGHSSWVESVEFSPDGTRIVSGSRDNTIRMWDAITAEHLKTLEGHSDWVLSVAFSPDGTRIVSGSVDATVRLWNAVNGQHLNTLIGHSSFVNSVAFTPDGTGVVSGSHDNTLRLWDALGGEHLKTLAGHFSSVQSTARSYHSCQRPSTDSSNPTGPVFGYIAADGWVYSITQNRRIFWIPVSCRPRMLDANGDRVVFGTKDGRVVILDFTSMDSYFQTV